MKRYVLQCVRVGVGNEWESTHMSFKHLKSAREYFDVEYSDAVWKSGLLAGFLSNGVEYRVRIYDRKKERIVP